MFNKKKDLILKELKDIKKQLAGRDDVFYSIPSDIVRLKDIDLTKDDKQALQRLSQDKSINDVIDKAILSMIVSTVNSDDVLENKAKRYAINILRYLISKAEEQKPKDKYHGLTGKKID